jgi:1,4-dihydroxy-2-naphthoate octaprenyltransferase
MITFTQFLRIVEIRTKVVSLSGFGIGAAYAWYRYGAPDAWILAVYLAAVLAVDMATTGFNTFFDFYFGVDRRGTNREADKVLVHQGVAAGPALLVSLGLYAIAAVLGIVLAIISSPWVIPIGAASMLVGFLYNAGPLPISRTPAGDLFAGGFLGWLLVTLSIFVLAPATMSTRDLLVGVPSLLMVASILTVNNTCDITGDAAAGRRTLSILVGHRWGERIVYLLGATAYSAVIVLAIVGFLPTISVLTTAIAAALSVRIYLQMHRQGYSHATKGPSMGAISKVFMWYTMGMILPLLLEAGGIVPPLR